MDVLHVTLNPTEGGTAVEAGFTTVSTATLVLTVPAELTSGTYNVQVTTSGGTTAVVPADVFTVI